MSKLCPCKKQFIDDLFMDVMLEANKMYRPGLMKLKGICVRKTLEVANIVESDCVCEKKEQRHHLDTHCLFCDKDLPVGQDGGYCTGCLTILKENAEKEKQSQSPCEHEWIKVSQYDVANGNNNTDVYLVPDFVKLYGCQKCGLVTCVEPNDK